MIRHKNDVTTENLKLELDSIKNKLELDHIEQAFLFPKFLQLETSRVCNSRCRYCAIDDWDKTVPFMPDKLFNKVLAEFAKNANTVKSICVNRAGEPLLDVKIVERIKALKDAGAQKITMSTNASLLTEKKATELLEAGLDDIMLSIDTVNRKQYEAIRRGLNFDTVLNNIQTLFKVRQKTNPSAIVRVRGVAVFDLQSKEGIAELDKWETYWNQYKTPIDRIYMKQAHSWGNQKEGEDIPDYKNVYHPCILPWSTMHITTMGIVPLCSQDYDAKSNLGNVYENSIKDIWQNSCWKSIRQLHSTGKRNDITYCRGCYLFDKEFSLEKKS